jgi:gliding motility-associated transport system ATP-binding protein
VNRDVPAQREWHMIHVENLTKYYGDLCAVDHINLDIRNGEILGLLGPNGAGKTTTLRMLTGYLLPTSGTIRVKEYDVHEDLLEIKRIMGYLPEAAPLYQGMLVYDYLAFVADVRGVERAKKFSRIRDLSDLCSLDTVMHNTIGELSKGFKQRVGLAHAMMSDPEILVLDEPTSGLDPNQIIEIREIIRRIGKEKTIVLSTHILSEAEATCDRIVIIDNGEIVADDSTEMLKRAVGKDQTVHVTLMNAAFDSVQHLLSSITGVAGIERTDHTPDGMLRVVIRCLSGDDPRADIYRAIKETDWLLMEFYQETKTLEHIFRELTQES